MHSTSSEPIITHGKGSRPFLILKLFWLISILKLQVRNPFCLDFPGKRLRRPENCSWLSFFLFFSPPFCPGVEDLPQMHNYFYLFQTICCAFNYSRAAHKGKWPITHSDISVLLFCSARCHNLLIPPCTERCWEKVVLRNNFVFNQREGERKGHEPIFSFVSLL